MASEIATTQERLLLEPLVTEKSDRLAKSYRHHFFKVALHATKGQIRQAVEDLFKVKVQSVHTLTVPGKYKRQGAHGGYRSDWKKAVVKLAPGQKLNLGRT